MPGPSKRLSPLLLVPLLLGAISLILQVRYHFFTIDHVSWLGMYDGDITYQVDRLMLDARTPGYGQISSINVDYGVELYLLAPLMAAINFLGGAMDPMNAYYAITIFHLITGLAAIALLSTFFEDGVPEKYLWLVVIIASPLFARHLSYIKPDASVVLLCVVLSLFFCRKALVSGRWIIASLFFGALGFSIKWWGLFCLVPVFTYAWQFDSSALRGLYHYLKKILLALPLVLPLVAYFVVTHVQAILVSNGKSNFLTQAQALPVALVAALIGTALAFAAYALGKAWAEKGAWPMKAISIAVLELLSFGTFYLITALPFVCSDIFLKSIWNYFVGEFKVDKLGTAARPGAVEGLLFWLKEFSDYHYLSPLLIVATLGLFAYLATKRKIPRDGRLGPIAWYLAAITAFIVLLLNRNNRALISMLYPLYTFVALYLFSLLPKSRWRYLAATAVALAQIIYQYNGKIGTLQSIYTDRDGLREDAREASLWLVPTFNHVEKFILADYGFPATREAGPLFEFRNRSYFHTDLEEKLAALPAGHAFVMRCESMEIHRKGREEALDAKKITRHPIRFMGEQIEYCVIENKPS